MSLTLVHSGVLSLFTCMSSFTLAGWNRYSSSSLSKKMVDLTLTFSYWLHHSVIAVRAKLFSIVCELNGVGTWMSSSSETLQIRQLEIKTLQLTREANKDTAFPIALHPPGTGGLEGWGKTQCWLDPTFAYVHQKTSWLRGWSDSSAD